jgi:hypothetical protein
VNTQKKGRSEKNYARQTKGLRLGIKLAKDELYILSLERCREDKRLGKVKEKRKLRKIMKHVSIMTSFLVDCSIEKYRKIEAMFDSLIDLSTS